MSNSSGKPAPDVQTIIVWSKPACQQCRMVKRRLEAASVPYVEQDLTAPESAGDLEHFRGLGYTSAPITEYGGIAVPGFMPTEVDRVVAAWRADQDAGSSTQPLGGETKFDFDPANVCDECFTVRATNGACACPA